MRIVAANTRKIYAIAVLIYSLALSTDDNRLSDQAKFGQHVSKLVVYSFSYFAYVNEANILSLRIYICI